MHMPEALRNAYSRLAPKQRQWFSLIGVVSALIGVLWIMFSASEPAKTPGSASNRAVEASKVTNVGVMAGGQQVKPLDVWVGGAGKKMAQYDRDKQEQEKLNKDNDAFKAEVAKRFGALDDRLRTIALSAQPTPNPAATPAVSATTFPPPSTLPANGQPAGQPGQALGGKYAPANYPPGAVPGSDPPRPELVRVSVAEKAKAPAPVPNPNGPPTGKGSGPGADASASPSTNNVDSYLPVSFARGTMLGGLDAPTGGQAQSNPHPILIRLDDNAILPNRFRSNVKECFVVAAGYGDISSERAYLRTENLSCVRADGTTLEVKIQGSVFGEDGLVGLRGKLVTKQGQMLANALLAGVMSGIGQGFAAQGSTVTTSTFGTVSTTEGSQAFKQGMGAGVGRALDRLANYYIKLAEATFPVIEIGAGRAVDVVITKGVRIEGGDLSKAEASPAKGTGRDGEVVRTGADDDY